MTVGQAHKAVAVFFGLLAAAAGVWFLRTSWSDGPDIDLAGFFWLVGNAGRLTLLLTVIVCAGAAISYWVRGMRESG